jgi:hypothetical protein
MAEERADGPASLPAGPAPSQRHASALVAQYIHEISRRHRG